MRKKRLAAAALAFSVATIACGCGDQMFEMTDDEKAVIVNYSAHVVSKFNTRQPEGIQDVSVLEKLLDDEEKRQEEKKQEEQAKKEDTAGREDHAALPDDSGQKTEQKNYVSLSNALQLDGIDAAYKSYEVCSAYKGSDSYSISAGSGKDLLVLHVNLKNQGNKTVNCDILSKSPSFMLNVNDKVHVPADTTILLNDLGTYQNKIKAGETKKTVLIFQVRHNAAKTVKSMDVEVRIGEKNSLVQLAQ